MLSAHPPVPLSQITISHSANDSSIPIPNSSRLTLHTATGRQLYIEDHGLPSPRILSPEGTPTASGENSPERRGSDEEKMRDGISRESTTDGGSYARSGDAFGGVARERVSRCLASSCLRFACRLSDGWMPEMASGESRYLILAGNQCSRVQGRKELIQSVTSDDISA